MANKSNEITIMKKVLYLFFLLIGALPINAQNVINEENYKGYSLVSYSDGTSKIFDKSDNWIQFNTEYEVNSFTGEATNKSIAARYYIDEERIKKVIAANIKDRSGYSISITNGGVVSIISPLGISCVSESETGMTFSDFLQVLTNKKKSKSFIEEIHKKGGLITSQNSSDSPYVQIKMPSGNIWFFDVSNVMGHQKLSDGQVGSKRRKLTRAIIGEPNPDKPIFDYGCNFRYVYSNQRDEISYMLPRILTGRNSIKAFMSYFSDLSELFGSNYVVKGINGNELVRKDNISYRKLNGKQIKGGYFDESCNRMYYPNDEYMMQLFSISASNTDNDAVLVNCLPTDTISNFVNNDKVGEIYFSNGDHLKFSKLRNGIVYDCFLHRQDGILIITTENDQPSSQYVFTSGEFEDFVYGKVKTCFYDDVLAIKSLFSEEDISDIRFDKMDKQYEEERRKAAEEVGIITTISSEVIEAQAKEMKEKRMQELYQKYGKKYVDALFNDNKILIGTPEGLIENNTNSRVTGETPYSKRYEITGVFGKWAAIVFVEKRNNKVYSVIYR